MEVHYGYEGLNLFKPVITTGVFDGVHLGHRMLLEKVVREAEKEGNDAVAVTFNPHPRIVLTGDPSRLRFLTDLDERISLIGETGIGHLVIIKFTHELSRMTACEFLEKVLCRHLGVNHLIAGFNHHFGRRQAGTSDTIMECSKAMGFTVTREGAFMAEGVPVSSSAIRDLLNKGAVEKAALLLGYDYFISGRVVSGKRIGRDIGFPTANIESVFEYKLIPRDGVYAVEVEVEGDNNRYPAMVNIGTRPTLRSSDGRKTIEAHLINFKGDIYSKRICLCFRYRMRDEMQFDDIQALAAQLARDRERAIDLLGS
jgi:riboflavin kinase/FMN adenylyltransferase